MPKSEVLTLVLGVVAVFGGYLFFNPSEAHDLVSWLRQEIRKDLPDPSTISHPNYTPVVPGKGL